MVGLDPRAMKSQARICFSIILPTLLAFSVGVTSTRASDDDLAELVRRLKSDSRGPFQSIAWFCPDGTVLPASQRCPEPGGFQRGLHKDAIEQAAKRGIYLGQLLVGQDRRVFLDQANGFSRARQYQMEAYLQRVDDGWIMRHARHYRGAISAADEEVWGGKFLKWLLADDAFVASEFCWVRELVRDIPHAEDGERAARVRTLAEQLAIGMPDFQPISDKIHSQPDSTDLASVREFHTQQGEGLPPTAAAILIPLESDLAWTYETITREGLAARYQSRLSHSAGVYRMLEALAGTTESDLTTVCDALADVLAAVGERVSVVSDGETRLALLDLSLALEQLLARWIDEWQPNTMGALHRRCALLARAAESCGYVEGTEWHELWPALDATSLGETETLVAMSRRISAARRMVNSALAKLDTTYGSTVELFSGFEPMAARFLDDRIAASILLAFGDAIARLDGEFARRAGVANAIVDLDSASAAAVHGLNPGVAVGELVVVHGRADNFAFVRDKIYVLQNAPAALEPVAGLMSVNDGNPVTHVQRMAARLAIPNAAIDLPDLEALTTHSGRLVFFAVSPRGRVIVKSTWDMTPEERELFAADAPAPASSYLESLDSGISPGLTIRMDEALAAEPTP